jgi:O-succinylbenzoate synthase
MKVDRVELHHVSLPFVHHFKFSGARIAESNQIIIAVYAEGITGWGEAPLSVGPYYGYETVATAWHVLEDYLIPLLLNADVETPAGVGELLGPIQGHNIAKSALEAAVWDLFAKAQGISLQSLLGGKITHIPVGVSVGVAESVDALLPIVESYLNEGYQRIKLKIKPGWDVEPVRAVRARWPELMLQVDANEAYAQANFSTFKELDAFGLLLIEQPFSADDLVAHAELQSLLKTPVCLDESIQSYGQARTALKIDACRVINVKPSRVGGLAAAKAIHDLCAAHGIPVWCGGMFESNIGRAVNLALASLPNFSLPGDISASSRYYQEDIAEPNFEINPDSTITVPTAPGIGIEVQPGRLKKYRQRNAVFDA